MCRTIQQTSTLKASGASQHQTFHRAPYMNFLLVLIVLLGSTRQNFAIDYTWTGNTSSSWNTAGNWSPNGIPGSSSGDVVTINQAVNAPVLSSSLANPLSSLTLSNNAGLTITGVTLNVNGLALVCGSSTGGSSLSGTGTLALNGNLTVTSHGSGSLPANISCNLNLITSASAFNIAAGLSSTSDLTIAGSLSGTVGVTKSGGGILTLSGSNGSHSGGITLSSGTLCINSTNAIGTGVFNISGTSTINNTSGSSITLSTNNSITLAGNLTFTGTNALNLGTGAVTNGGNYTFTLNGSNSTLTLGGTLTNTSGVNQTTTVNGSGNTLILGGYNLSNSSSSLTGAFNGNANVQISGTVANGGTATASAFTYSGTGTCTLSGNNTFSGAMTISSGTVSGNTLNNTGSSSSFGNGSGTATITIGASGTLFYNGSGHSTNRPLAIGSGSTISASGSGTLTLTGGITGTAANLILTGTGNGAVTTTAIATTSGTLTKRGTGAWTLSATSTYTGQTVISGGTLIAGGSVASNTNGPLGRATTNIFLGDATTTANNSSPTFLIGGGFTIGRNVHITTTATTGTYSVGGMTDNNATISGQLIINNPITITQVATSGGNTLTFSGGMTTGSAGLRTVLFNNSGSITVTTGQILKGLGNLTLTKQGTGTLTISSTGTYTGGFTLNSGTLNMNNAAALGTSAGTFTINGGTLDNTSGSAIVASYPVSITGNFTFGGTGDLDLGTLATTVTNNDTITTLGTATLALGGTIDQSAVNLVKSGTGNLYFGTNPVTLNSLAHLGGVLLSFGTTTLYGNLTIGSGAGLTNFNINFAGTGTQNISSPNSFNLSGLTCSGSGNVNCQADLTVSGTFTFSGTGNFTIGSGKTLTLTGNLVGCNPTSCFVGSNTSNLSLTGGNILSSALFFSQTAGSDTSLNTLTINKSGRTVTLGNTLKLVGQLNPINGTINTNNFLILESKSSGTASIASGGCASCSYITGNVVVRRYIPGSARRWRFLSSPISNASLNTLKNDIYVTGAGGALNGFDETVANAPSVYSYDETVTSGTLDNGWIAASSINDGLNVGTGYRIFVRGDRSDPGRLDGSNPTQNNVTLNFSGAVNTGSIALSPTYTSSGTSSNDGWNLIGNPYPSAIDWNAIHDNGRSGSAPNYSGTNYEHLNPVAYIFDASTNSYTAYNAVSNTGTGNFSTGIIPLGAAFFIKAEAALPTLTLVESNKSASTPAAIFKTGIEEPFRIRLIAENQTSDEIALLYHDSSSVETDAFDIPKLYNTQVNLAAMTPGGLFQTLLAKPLPANGTDSIPLSMGIASSGTYQLCFRNALQFHPTSTRKIYLIDRYAKTRIDVESDTSYRFSADISNPLTYGNGRFYLTTTTLLNSLSPEEDNAASQAKAYPNPVKDLLQLQFSSHPSGKGTLRVINPLGETVQQEEVRWTDSQLSVKLKDCQSGIYFVQLKDSEGHLYTFKVVKA